MHKPDEALNSYDCFKLLALLTMTVDHVGAYLLPDELWLRAIGRCSAPIWLFLAGYGARLPISTGLIAGAMLVALLEGVLKEQWLPLNILFSIILSRFALVKLGQRGWFMREPLTLLVGCALIAPITLYLFDYGTHALLFAALGYLTYYKTSYHTQLAGLLIGWLSYGGIQLAGFTFSLIDIAIMTACCAVCALWMARFHYINAMIAATNQGLKGLLWLSRHSLYYYVLHLTVLMSIGTAIKLLAR